MSMTNKDFRARARIGTQLAVAAAAAALLSAPEVRAQTVYNVAGIADFTGPYADVMKDLAGCRKTVFDWWNEEVGKPAGVALRIKDFDGRYDVAQISSLWPGMKSELNPVAALGLGGPDVAALAQQISVQMVLPPGSAEEAALVPDAQVVRARHLLDVVRAFLPPGSNAGGDAEVDNDGWSPLQPTPLGAPDGSITPVMVPSHAEFVARACAAPLLAPHSTS